MKRLLFLLCFMSLNSFAQNQTTILSKGTVGYVVVDGQVISRNLSSSYVSIYRGDTTIQLNLPSGTVPNKKSIYYLDGDNGNTPFPFAKPLLAWLDSNYSPKGQYGDSTVFVTFTMLAHAADSLTDLPASQIPFGSSLNKVTSSPDFEYSPDEFKVISDYFNFAVGDWKMLSMGNPDSVDFDAAFYATQLGDEKDVQVGVGGGGSAPVVNTFAANDVLQSYNQGLYTNELYIAQHQDPEAKTTQIYDGTEYCFWADGVGQTLTIGNPDGLKTIYQYGIDQIVTYDNEGQLRVIIDPQDAYIQTVSNEGVSGVGSSVGYAEILAQLKKVDASNSNTVRLYATVDTDANSYSFALSANHDGGDKTPLLITQDGINLSGGMSFQSIQTVNLSSTPDTAVLLISDYTILANTGTLIITDTVAVVMPENPSQGKTIRISKTNADAVIAVLDNSISLIGYIKSGSKYDEADFDGSNWYLLTQ